MGEIVGHQRRGKGEGKCGNQQVHGTDRLTGSFQLEGNNWCRGTIGVSSCFLGRAAAGMGFESMPRCLAIRSTQSAAP